jgi:hypothetical protein
MRDSSARRLTSLPDKFTPDFVERLDKRTAIARGVLGRIREIESDAGGAENMSHARRSLVRRVMWLECVVESSEQRLAAGEAIDLGSHVQAVNSLMGIYRCLGLERRQRSVRSLREVMNGTPP